MTMKYRHEFEVTGTGAFPLDQLRYDSCFPSTTADCQTIHRTLVTIGIKQTEQPVKLEKFTTGADPQITHGRWNSFGWKFVQGSHRAVKL